MTRGENIEGQQSAIEALSAFIYDELDAKK